MNFKIHYKGQFLNLKALVWVFFALPTCPRGKVYPLPKKESMRLRLYYYWIAKTFDFTLGADCLLKKFCIHSFNLNIFWLIAFCMVMIYNFGLIPGKWFFFLIFSSVPKLWIFSHNFSCTFFINFFINFSRTHAFFHKFFS